MYAFQRRATVPTFIYGNVIFQKKIIAFFFIPRTLCLDKYTFCAFEVTFLNKLLLDPGKISTYL